MGLIMTPAMAAYGKQNLEQVFVQEIIINMYQKHTNIIPPGYWTAREQNWI